MEEFIMKYSAIAVFVVLIAEYALGQTKWIKPNSIKVRYFPYSKCR